MALIYKATVTPSKLELLAAWLPAQAWYQAAHGDLARVASYRFDDPDGEVGVETLLIRAGDGPIFQIPLTYRAAPLVDADEWLIGTTEHTVLGERWVYDATADPVYAATLARAIIADAGQADQAIESDGELKLLPPSMTITSTGAADAEVPAVTVVRRVAQGDPTTIQTDVVELGVFRRLGDRPEAERTVLHGTWADQQQPVPLAYAAPLR